MSRFKISVIVSTIHYGGMDVLFNCLEHQTLSKDQWELILVDAFYDDRPGLIVDAYGKCPGVNLIHISPKSTKPYFDASTPFNTGASVAQGELVLYMSDFQWAYPQWLEDHWRLYQEHPGYSMSGYADRFEFPPIKATTLANDWSCFEQEFTADFAAEWFKQAPFYQERKAGIERWIPITEHYEIPGGYIYFAVNESIPLAVLKELNGFDERLNGVYGNNDRDLGARANMIGWKFMLNQKSIVNRLGNRAMAHAKLPGIKKTSIRTVEDNYRIVTEKLDRIQRGEESPRTPDGWGIV